MPTFYFIVLSIATLVLFITLFLLGYLMNKKTNKLLFPPSYNSCPDYWAVSDTSKNCKIPTSSFVNVPANLLTNSVGGGAGYTPGFDDANKEINFNDSKWSEAFPSMTTQCAWKKWADGNRIVWDGITNFNSC